MTTPASNSRPLLAQEDLKSYSQRISNKWAHLDTDLNFHERPGRLKFALLSIITFGGYYFYYKYTHNRDTVCNRLITDITASLKSIRNLPTTKPEGREFWATQHPPGVTKEKLQAYNEDLKSKPLDLVLSVNEAPHAEVQKFIREKIANRKLRESENQVKEIIKKKDDIPERWKTYLIIDKMEFNSDDNTVIVTDWDNRTYALIDFDLVKLTVQDVREYLNDYFPPDNPSIDPVAQSVAKKRAEQMKENAQKLVTALWSRGGIAREDKYGPLNRKIQAL